MKQSDRATQIYQSLLTLDTKPDLACSNCALEIFCESKNFEQILKTVEILCASSLSPPAPTLIQIFRLCHQEKQGALAYKLFHLIISKNNKTYFEIYEDV